MVVNAFLCKLTGLIECGLEDVYGFDLRIWLFVLTSELLIHSKLILASSVTTLSYSKNAIRAILLHTSNLLLSKANPHLFSCFYCPLGILFIDSFEVLLSFHR